MNGRTRAAAGRDRGHGSPPGRTSTTNPETSETAKHQSALDPGFHGVPTGPHDTAGATPRTGVSRTPLVTGSAASRTGHAGTPHSQQSIIDASGMDG